MKALYRRLVHWFGRSREMRWLSHLLLTLGAAVSGGLLSLLVDPLPWVFGVWIGASLAVGAYCYREGGDIADHRKVWEFMEDEVGKGPARLYRRRWTFDGWMGLAGPALVWTLATLLTIAIYGG